MSDRELLELAAKAAGVKWERITQDGWLVTDSANELYWNPLENDGDALRLAVKLGFEVQGNAVGCRVGGDDGQYFSADECGGDPYAATRRAIVRAAAEIGKTLTGEN